MIRRQQLGREQALQKIRQYCAYQERSHAEVREKLYSFGLWTKDVEFIISQLIEEDYLNEERFATAFAGGKFRMKSWGRVRIRHELKQKRVSEYCIKKALREIDEADYLSRLEKLGTEKWESLKSERNIFIRKRKVQDYLLQKGYEADLVGKLLTEINKKEK
ncbi:MAG TPA: regulatory protein RecX [Puia sp.]|nr:regulatory protein RecX [Puia sp.]